MSKRVFWRAARGCIVVAAFLVAAYTAQAQTGAQPAMELYPTYHAVGVDAAYTGEVTFAQMDYKLPGETKWREGMEPTASTGRDASGKRHLYVSVFRLDPGEQVSVRMTLRFASSPLPVVLTQTTTTRTAPTFAAKPHAAKNRNFYVRTSGVDSPSRDGSKSQPYRTIAWTIENKLKTPKTSGGGTTIWVGPGTYEEAVNLDGVQGDADNPCVLRGEVFGVNATTLPTTAQTNYQSRLPVLTGKKSILPGTNRWTRQGTTSIWEASVPDLWEQGRNLGYLSRNDKRLYRYQNLRTLVADPIYTGTGPNPQGNVEANLTQAITGRPLGSSFALPAWTYDAQAKKLYLHLESDDADPNRDRFDYAVRGVGVSLSGSRYVVVRDLEITHFGAAGIALKNNTDDCFVYNNLVHHVRTGITVLDSVGEMENNTVWQNQVYERGVSEYSWRAWMSQIAFDVDGDPKTPDQRIQRDGALALVVDAGRGSSIVANKVHGFFDNFYLVSSSSNAPDSITRNRDTDVLDNVSYNCGDDSFELDGGGVNLRVLDNISSNGLEGVSLAPIVNGPIYFIGNRMLGRLYAYKMINTPPSPGATYVYHNSARMVTGAGFNMAANRLDKDGKPVVTPFTDKYLCNNLLVVSASPIVSARDVVLDGNNYWRDSANAPRGSLYTYTETPPAQGFDSLEAFRKATGKEQHGTDGNPHLTDPPYTFADLVAAFQNETFLPVDLKVNGAASSVTNRAVPIRGLNGEYVGSAPDIGAYENNAKRRYRGRLIP